MRVEELFQEFDTHREELLKEYFELLRIPSISSEAEYQPEVLKAAAWVETFLKRMGARTERWEGNGHPVIFGEYLTSPDRPTLLIYQHYDVQPVDPLEAWISPPFEPTIRDGQVYARGAQDNKGQCFYTLAAARALIRKLGTALPNLKFVIEGEEETGSTVIGDLVVTKRKELKADGLIIPDVGIKGVDTPSITLGARGMISMTVTFTSAGTDMHSGMLGGIVVNPNQALVGILAAMHDSANKVAVPGFYDAVRELSPEEMKVFDFTFDESLFRHIFNADPCGGETKYSPLARSWIRPTIEFNGIGGGYTGSGFKTVIPASALAKISCRLVPDQDPDVIGQLVKKFILDRVPNGVKVDIDLGHGGGVPFRTGPDARISKIAEQAFSEVFNGKSCSKILTGGSIPIVSDLAKASGAEAVLLGYGLPSDNLHAPNEHFGLDRLRLGYATIGRFIQLFGG